MFVAGASGYLRLDNTAYSKKEVPGEGVVLKDDDGGGDDDDNQIPETRM